MQLTRYTDYGFRILIYLALLPKDSLAHISDISETYDLSKNHVNKIVHQLGREQIIETKRGKNGGFKLAKKPEDINIGKTLLLLESTLNIIDCQSPYCAILPACRLKHMFADATRVFLAELEKFTLEDVLSGQKAALTDLLLIEKERG